MGGLDWRKFKNEIANDENTWCLDRKSEDILEDYLKKGNELLKIVKIAK